MFPRGNHWAVGHLMGKKSIESLPDTTQDSHYLTASDTGVTADQYEGLMGALMQHRSQRQTAPNDLLHRGWREEDRDKYLREIPHFLLLALKLQDRDST
ncbi:hypothetical protein LDENG_00124750 [Lucifuga dentata]|nr:hypothetical protein LDENG_00124750 [Lucifuga dentata]